MVRKLIFVSMLVLSLFASDQNLTQQAKFTITAMDGKQFHFIVTERGVQCKECAGKVIILDFFGKHCPPCREMIPVLGKLQKALPNKLQIIGFHVQEKLTPSDMTFLKHMGIDYPVVDMMASNGNYDFISYIGQASGWQNSIPYMLFFDKKGQYRGHHYGIASYESLKEAVEQLYAPTKQKKESR